MTASRAFRPPKTSPFILGLVKRCMPLMMRAHGHLSVRIADADLQTLRSFKGKRLLLLPNHPTHSDPLVMLEITRRVRENVNFVAAREVFDWDFGMRGWMFQRCGIYSLIRGAVDRESFKTTQEVLVAGLHWLIIFIEGEVNLENDALIPFEPGVFQLALRAQATLAETCDAPIHAAPVAMKTFYHAGVEQPMAKAVSRLEKAVGIAPKGPFTTWPDLATRLAQIGGKVLLAVERELGTPSQTPDAPIAPRFETLRNRLLTNMESYLDIQPAADVSMLDRIRAVRNRIDKIIYTYQELPDDVSTYEREAVQRRRKIFHGFDRDLRRLISFLTFKPGYITPDSPPERYAELLIRLEHEILDKQHFLYRRTAVVQLGTPINLRDHLIPNATRTQTKQATQTLARQFESQMLHLLSTAPRPGNG